MAGSKIYDNDSKYFDNRNINIDKSFFIQIDYNTGTKYRVPLREINNDEYISDPNIHYITQKNMRFDYNYLYYIKEKFGQYNIQNIIKFKNQNYCIPSIMNYRTFDPIPTITENQRRNSPYGYCSYPIIYWAPLSNIFNDEYPIEQGRYWISTSGNIYDVKANKYLFLGGIDCELLCTNKNHITKDWKTITCKIDKLVLSTFAYFPGCEQYIIYHKNRDIFDNRIENLEWLTREEYNNVKS